MRTEYKIFIIIIFLLLSIPTLFFSWGLLNLEYNELIKYGNVEEGVIINSYIETYTGASAEFGSDYKYDITIVNGIKNKKYSAYIKNINSSQIDKEDEEFISNVKNGDTIQVKILSSNQAKILKWKKLELNQRINYWGKIGRWLLISLLVSLTMYLYFKIYKTIIK